MRVALAFALWLCAAPALADAFADVVPQSHERVIARARALEASLAHSLAAWPSVAEARITLDLPDGACLPLDRPLPPAAGSVLLRLEPDAPVPDPARIQSVVRGAARELRDAEVRVTVARAPRVAKANAVVSNGATRVFLVASLLANVTLATVLLMRRRRHRGVSTSY